MSQLKFNAVAAPASPAANKLTVYMDLADGKLKSKDSAGTVTILGAGGGSSPPFLESDITGLVADLAAKAPLASPALTGVPTAPTAAALTNTTQISTTAFVQAAIAALVASAPGTLDTLNELALALASDPNFATTMATALALKAPLASPALTGVPTAPTAAAATNTTQLATTAMVQAAIAAVIAAGIAQSAITGLGAALALLAPLASPTLTGTPAAPTAAAGTNTTQLATTAFVESERAVHVDGTTSSATPTPTIAGPRNAYDLTAQAAAAAFANPTGTPVNFDQLIIRIKDNGTARALTWGSAYVAGGVALPSTTVLGKILTIGFIYNTANALNKWMCVAVSQEV